MIAYARRSCVRASVRLPRFARDRREIHHERGQPRMVAAERGLGDGQRVLQQRPRAGQVARLGPVPRLGMGQREIVDLHRLRGEGGLVLSRILAWRGGELAGGRRGVACLNLGVAGWTGAASVSWTWASLAWTWASLA